MRRRAKRDLGNYRFVENERDPLAGMSGESPMPDDLRPPSLRPTMAQAFRDLGIGGARAACCSTDSDRCKGTRGPPLPQPLSSPRWPSVLAMRAVAPRSLLCPNLDPSRRQGPTQGRRRACISPSLGERRVSARRRFGHVIPRGWEQP
jgi:hypothetical protein